MIDFHVHIGERLFPDPKQRYLTVEQLIDMMNASGIEKSVLLPLENPESGGDHGNYFPTSDALEACRRYPERLIPFCSVDPRRRNVVGRMEIYAEMGCKGFGEHKVGLYIDDERSKRIYKQCGEMNWAIVFHLDPNLNIDESGLPRLEKLLKEFPKTIFVMHGPGWWCEMSADSRTRGGYPGGKIQPGGAVNRLLQNYPNIYADLSAGSGYRALTRDPDYTQGFLERNWKKLLFATDYLKAGQATPMVNFIRELDMDDEKVEAIARGNSMRLLNIPDSAFRRPFTQ